MSNLRNAPLFLTPQAVRTVLGEGHARNMVELQPLPMIQFAKDEFEHSKYLFAEAVVNSDPVLSVYASCEWDELSDDGKEWIVAIIAQATSQFAVVPPIPLQSRDGDQSSPDPIVVPVSPIRTGATPEPQPCSEPSEASNPGSACRDEELRRVAAPVSASAETAGTGANIKAAKSADQTLANDTMSKSAPIGSNWLENRFGQIAAAIAFLKTKCILVQVIDRDAMIKRYRVTGKRYPQMAEDVVKLATYEGWSGTW